MKALRHTALLLCIAFAAAADDDTRFRAALVGTQEVPAIFAAGSAIFEARVLDNDTRIEFQLTYEHLTAPPLVAHVHFGQRGVAGNVSFFLCGGGGKPSCPASTSGTVTGTVVAANVVGPAVQGIAPGDLAAILQMIRAGLGYANMHTPLHPGGEIRGQIRVVDGPDKD
jgi:DNA-binding transcriptional LysR family regulator